MSNMHVIIKLWKIARILFFWNKITSPTKKNNHQTMSEDNEVDLIRQSFDGLFDNDDQTYTYHPLDELSSGWYLCVSSLWTKMTANCYLVSLLAMLLRDGTTTSTRPCSLTQWVLHTNLPLNESLSGWYLYFIKRESIGKNQTSLIRPIRSNQALDRSSEKRTMIFNWNSI